jgi:hypothetical protein
VRRGHARAGHGAPVRPWRPVVAVIACALAVSLLAPAAAWGAPPLKVGFADGVLASSSSWLDRAARARVGIARVNVSWRQVVGGRPANPANPADPSYNFGQIDGAVQGAAARGLAVLLTVYDAPGWAEGSSRPQSAPAGSWKPNPRKFRSFAHALATRYSGAFLGLPRVRYFQAWNEPNLHTYLTPQWRHKKPKGAQLYRRLLNGFFAGVKSAVPGDTVVTAGTAPYGEPPGGDRTRPLTFWRKVFCLNERLKPRKCKTKPRLNALAHHPINTSGGPHRSAINRNDATTPDFKHLRRILHAAERSHHIRPAGRHHQLWATEFWWESKPPDRFFGFPLHRQARWIEEAFYLLWKQGARVAILLQLRDEPGDPGYGLQSGVFFANGKPKPSLKAVRFPFVTERRSPRRVRAWGKAPAGGTLRIERKRNGQWRTIRKLSVGEGRVFRKGIRVRGGATLRARVQGQKSLAWHQRRNVG